jgi:hypothetical protein
VSDLESGGQYRRNGGQYRWNNQYVKAMTVEDTKQITSVLPKTTKGNKQVGVKKGNENVQKISRSAAEK